MNDIAFIYIFYKNDEFAIISNGLIVYKNLINLLAQFLKLLIWNLSGKAVLEKSEKIIIRKSKVPATYSVDVSKLTGSTFKVPNRFYI